MQARTCFAKGCRTRVQASRLMCLKHWRMVPAAIQDRVWKHYRKGQTLATISKEYGQAVRDARKAVAVFEGVADPEVQTIRTALERRGYELLAVERYDDGTMRVRVTHATFGPYSSPTSVYVCRCWCALWASLGAMPVVKSITKDKSDDLQRFRPQRAFRRRCCHNPARGDGWQLRCAQRHPRASRLAAVARGR